MADLIQATPDQLRTTGTQFVTHGGDIDTILKQLDTLKDQMIEMWKGASSEAFVNEYEELRPSFTNFVKLIDGVGQQIQSVANALEQADSDIAGQIRVGG